MSNIILKVEFSAEDKFQADDILNALLTEKLVTGGQYIQAPARFLWKGKVADMEYVTVTAYTLEKHRAAIVKVIESISAEEVPMITFSKLECSEKMHEWVKETVS